MDNEVKQRNRRRKRAQRMQAQREASNKQKDASGAQDSGEDESPIREKPQRPPNRRKKSKEPLVEEDIVDGFSILGFRTYEDLEAVIRLATKTGVRCLTAPVIDEKFRSEKLELEKEKQRNKEINSLSTTLNNHHHIPLTHTQTHSNLTLSHDPGTSDDSGRASERLTGSSVAPRDPDSSRDRLSDASSRCSSGKGYICDSEGEDDKFPVVAAEPTPSVSATYNNVTPNPTLKSIAPTKKVSESISKSVIQPKVSKTGSDAGSVLFASTPAPARKLEFPSALSIGNGDSAASPVPAPTPPSMAPPTPSPAPAALPPPQQSYTTPPSAAAQHPPVQPLQPQPQSQQQPPPPRLQSPPPTCAAAVAVSVTVTRVATPPISVPVTMPQPAPAAAPAPVVHLPPALDSTADVSHGRTDSPAVATSANAAVAPGSGGGSSYPAFPSLYAPYAVHSPYTAPSPAPAPASLTNAAPPVPTTTSSAVVNVPPPVTVAAVTVTTTSHRDTVTSTRTHSPRGHSPTRERDSYSSNVSSLSRGSLTPFSTAAPSVTVSSSLAFSKPTPSVWPTTPTSTAVTSQLSPATSVPRPTPPLASMHPFSAPMFAPPPLPPPVSTASPLGLPTNSVPNPNPFSAESLFQTNQTDMLRRELDNRFLASQDRSMNVGPPPYLRAEMHQHQHHHTHVHQHTTPLLPPPPASSLFPAPLFKDIPKMGSVDSPFYRQNLGLSSYPGYSGLLHPGLGGPTPFVPPNHLPTFQPKQSISDASKLKPIVKTGKWNAMHVRVAWEIYHSQQKQQSEVKAGLNTKADLLRPPSHMFPGSLIHSARPHELSYPPSLAGHRPPTFDPQPHHGSLFTNPTSHLVHRTAPGSGISPFSRYGTAFNAPGSPFTMSPFPSTRDLPPLGLHDPWRLQRTVPGFPAPVPQSPWGLKPDPAVLERREQEEREREQRERERERCRREREERERREREEKQRKQLEQQQQQERERERREKERREMERREMERERERERERILHQQRLAESNKQAAALAARDRSPLRNGTGDINEVRVKEEPRTKDDDVVLLSRTTDHRYHPYLNRHASNTLPPHASVLDRSRNMLPPLPGPPLSSHYAPPPTTHWPTGPDPYGYRFDHLRYNPLMEAAIRVEEERAKMFSAYNAHNNHLRGKDPGPPTGLLHMRPGTGPGPPPHKLCATPPNNDMHKKDDSSQSR